MLSWCRLANNFEFCEQVYLKKDAQIIMFASLTRRINHIFGIPDPDLPIHYATSMRLNGSLMAVYLWKYHTGGIWSKKF